MGAVSLSGGREIPRWVVSEGSFLGASALLFAASTALTIVWCTAMSGMDGMRMPGGWTMSMVWMRMPGQTWPGAAATFLGMWVVMMVAMMLPAFVPMLWRYRQAVRRTATTRLGGRTTLVCIGYFVVWAVVGMAAFPFGVALAAAEMQRAGACARGSGRGSRDRTHVRRAAVDRLEIPAAGLLPGGAGARRVVAGGCRHGLALRSAPRPPVQLLLWQPDGDPPRGRSHGPARDGRRDGGHHR